MRLTVAARRENQVLQLQMLAEVTGTPVAGK